MLPAPRSTRGPLRCGGNRCACGGGRGATVPVGHSSAPALSSDMPGGSAAPTAAAAASPRSLQQPRRRAPPLYALQVLLAGALGRGWLWQLLAPLRGTLALHLLLGQSMRSLAAELARRALLAAGWLYGRLEHRRLRGFAALYFQPRRWHAVLGEGSAGAGGGLGGGGGQGVAGRGWRGQGAEGLVVAMVV